MFSKITNYIKNEDYKITLMSNQLYIYNYKSIVDITENEIYIKLENKIIKIYGSNLKLLKLDKKELLLSGKFNKVDINE